MHAGLCPPSAMQTASPHGREMAFPEGGEAEGGLGRWQFPTSTGSPQAQGDQLTFRPHPPSALPPSSFPKRLAVVITGR